MKQSDVDSRTPDTSAAAAMASEPASTTPAPAKPKARRSKSTPPKPATSAAAKLEAKKDLIRQEIYDRRQSLRAGERSAKSRDICNQVLSALQNSGVKGRNGQPLTVAVYSAKRFEVDLDRFIRGAYALGCRIAFPCMVPQASSVGCMRMRAVSCLNYLGGSVPFVVDPMKSWGPATSEEQMSFGNAPTGSSRRFIPSRAKGSVPPKDDTRFPVVSPEEIDFAIVPVVAFDSAGNRLGYGGGVYDRYLPQLRKDCPVLGVAFAEQEVDAVPHAKHDVPLPNIIRA